MDRSHDATLLTLQVNWKTGEVVMLIDLGRDGRQAKVECTKVSSVQLSRRFPWYKTYRIGRLY